MLRNTVGNRQILIPRDVATVGHTLLVELSTTKDGEQMVLAVSDPGMIRCSMATEKCTLVAIEKCTLFGSRRGENVATGAGAPDGVQTPIMTLLPGSRRAPRRRRGRLLGGWPWRVPCGVASGSCCPGC